MEKMSKYSTTKYSHFTAKAFGFGYGRHMPSDYGDAK